jgi:hypothetical protein
MKYDKAKTYVVKMNNVKQLMEKIEDVSSVIWHGGKTPREFLAKIESHKYFYPKNGAYCIYNGRYGHILTWDDVNTYEFSINLTENEFVDMLSELHPKQD